MSADYDGNNTAWHGGYGGNQETKGIKIEPFIGSPPPSVSELQMKDLKNRIEETKFLIKHAENENVANWYKQELIDLEKKLSSILGG